MTSSLRKKRQTTAPSTKRATASRRAWAGFLAACLAGNAFALAGEPSQQWTAQSNKIVAEEVAPPSTYRDQAGEVPTPRPSPSTSLKWRVRQPASALVEEQPEAAATAKKSETNPIQIAKKLDAMSALAAAKNVEPARLSAAVTKPEAAKNIATVTKSEETPVRRTSGAVAKDGPVSVMKANHEGTDNENTAVKQVGSPFAPRTARSVKVQMPFDEGAPAELAPQFVIPDEPATKAAAPAVVEPKRETYLKTTQPSGPPSMASGPINESRERCPPGAPCRDAFGECKAAWDTLKKTSISQLNLNIAVKGVQGEDFPCECQIENEPFMGRHWACLTYTWKATGTCYKPLYFEEPGLERYGHNHGHCIQPFVSGVHFFGSLFALPYLMGVETPCECVYPLGWYRPGDCAPQQCPAVPLSLRGGLAEVGTATGLVFIVP